MTAEQLTQVLEALELTQRKVAQMCGVEQSTVWRWRTGKREIPGPMRRLVRTWMKYPSSIDLD